MERKLRYVVCVLLIGSLLTPLFSERGYTPMIVYIFYAAGTFFVEFIMHSGIANSKEMLLYIIMLLVPVFLIPVNCILVVSKHKFIKTLYWSLLGYFMFFFITSFSYGLEDLGYRGFGILIFIIGAIEIFLIIQKIGERLIWK